MSMHDDEFSAQYLRTWTEPDPDRRRMQIERMWVLNGQMVVSSMGLTLEGVDAIDAHIARVYEDNIAGRGVEFRYDQQVEAGDSILLRSSMLAPSGESVGRGADVVFRDEEGKVTKVYMFMGVD